MEATPVPPDRCTDPEDGGHTRAVQEKCNDAAVQVRAAELPAHTQLAGGHALLEPATSLRVWSQATGITLPPARGYGPLCGCWKEVPKVHPGDQSEAKRRRESGGNRLLICHVAPTADGDEGSGGSGLMY